MQIVYIDLIPQKEKPIVNLSQYDNDRLVRFMLLENGEEYTLTGTETIDVNIRKPDGNIVVINPTVTANKYVDVLFTEQSTACHGKSFGEISIKENSTIIGTCNFIMDVEKSPTCGGIESTTEIANLQTQIDDIISGEGYLKDNDVAQVALSGNYNDLINKPDMSDYYTKSQTDALLNNKVDNSTLSSYYTKSQTDALLNNKVDNSTLSSYYTKSETEALIDDRLLDIMPVETQTGNPCTFDTDIATSLVSLRADIVASGGGGTPSTPIPIVGYSAVNLTYNGTPYLVQFGQTVYGGVYDANRGNVRITHVLFEKAIADMNNYDDFPGWTNSGARAILETEGVYTVNGNVGNTFGTNFIGNNDVLFLPRASYGGLTQTQWMTNYPDLVVQFVLPLATPIEIDVSELSVDTIVGVNNISSDCNGDVTASYKVSIQKYVDDRT